MPSKNNNPPAKPTRATPRSKTQPRYAWLHQSLLNDIVAGKYPVGSLLPTEAQLSATFGVSRHTVREATRRLVDTGMIVRYPSIGTVVTSAQPGAAQPSYIAGLGTMKDLLAYCPEERHLVYGNLSLRNMLAENGRITALLDWLDASYGDFVYDIASLDFWWPPLGLRAAFKQDQQRRQRDLPFYAERLLCYECHHALNGLRFFAKGGNLPAYQMVKGLIQQKIAAYEAR